MLRGALASVASPKKVFGFCRQVIVIIVIFLGTANMCISSRLYSLFTTMGTLLFFLFIQSFVLFVDVGVCVRVCAVAESTSAFCFSSERIVAHL